MAQYYNKKKKINTIDNRYTPSGSEESLSKTVSDVGLHPKSLEVFQNAKLDTVRDLAMRTERDLFRIQGFSKKTLFDVQRAFVKLGVTLKPDTDTSEIGEVKSQQENIARPQQTEAVRERQQGQRTERINNNPQQQQKPTERGAGSFKDLINNSLQGGGGRDFPRERQNQPTQQRDNRDRGQQRDVKDRMPLGRDNRDNRDMRDNKDNRNRDNRDSDTRNNQNRNGERDNRQNTRGQKPQKVVTPLDPNALIKYMKDGKYGYKNGRSEMIIPAQYDELFTFKEDLAGFEQNGFFGFIDKSNKVVVPADKYLSVMSFSEGYAAVMLEEKYGYIDKENNMIIPCLYDAATAFENNQARVKLDGKWGVIEKDGAVKWNLK